MYFDKSKTIEGVRLIKVRDLLRRMGGGRWMREGIADFIGKDIADAAVAEGFLEADPKDSLGRVQKGYYGTTALGRRLRATKFLPRINREKAEGIIQDLIARADAINTDDALIFRVGEIRGFGSYFEDTDDIGDIDIIVQLEARHQDHSARNLARAEASGRRFSGYSEMLGFGEREVRGLLSKVSRYVSECMDDPRELKVEFHRIYPPAPRRP